MICLSSNKINSQSFKLDINLNDCCTNNIELIKPINDFLTFDYYLNDKLIINYNLKLNKQDVLKVNITSYDQIYYENIFEQFFYYKIYCNGNYIINSIKETINIKWDCNSNDFVIKGIQFNSDCNCNFNIYWTNYPNANNYKIFINGEELLIFLEYQSEVIIEKILTSCNCIEYKTFIKKNNNIDCSFLNEGNYELYIEAYDIIGNFLKRTPVKLLNIQYNECYHNKEKLNINFNEFNLIQNNDKWNWKLELNPFFNDKKIYLILNNIEYEIFNNQIDVLLNNNTDYKANLYYLCELDCVLNKICGEYIQFKTPPISLTINNCCDEWLNPDLEWNYSNNQINIIINNHSDIFKYELKWTYLNESKESITWSNNGKWNFCINNNIFIQIIRYCVINNSLIKNNNIISKKITI